MTQETQTTETEAANTSEGAATSNTAAEAATAAATGGEQAAQSTQEETKGEQEKPQGAPEAYEFKAPEGKEFDPKVIEEFSAVAKELDLSQDKAQSMLDRLSPVLAARQEQALADARAKWTADTKADTEIGGTALAEKLAVANKAFTDHGTPELRKLLDESGLGEHPEMIRWAYRVGKAMSEDGFVAGRSNTAAADARNLYSKSNMNP